MGRIQDTKIKEGVTEKLNTQLANVKTEKLATISIQNHWNDIRSFLTEVTNQNIHPSSRTMKKEWLTIFKKRKAAKYFTTDKNKWTTIGRNRTKNKNLN